MRTLATIFRSIILVVLIVWAAAAGAQTYDMGERIDFKVTRTLGAAYNGNVATVVAQYPAAVAGFRAWWGLSDAEILSVYEAAAVVWQAAWSGDGYLPGSQSYDKLQSRTEILHTHGAFFSNIPLPLHLGQNLGRGMNYNDAMGTTGGTCWKIDEAHWIAKCGERTLWRSIVAGGNAGSGDYLEGAVLQDMCLSGGRFMVAAATNAPKSIGIDADKLGSNSYIHNIKADGFDYGMRVKYGIPVNVDLYRAFGSNIAAVWLWGTALSSMDFKDVEVDDTPVAFTMTATTDQAAGSKSLNIPNLKVEFGKRGRLTGLGKMLDLRGQFSVIMDNATSSGYNSARCEAAITIDAGSKGCVQGRNFMHCGNSPAANSYDYFLIETTSGGVRYGYKMPPYCTPFDFKWKNGVFTSDPVVTKVRIN